MLPNLSGLSLTAAPAAPAAPTAPVGMRTEQGLRRDDRPESPRRDSMRSDDGKDDKEDPNTFYFYGAMGEKLKMNTSLNKWVFIDLPLSDYVIKLSARDGDGFLAHLTQISGFIPYAYELYAFFKTPLNMARIQPLEGVSDPSRNRDHPYVYGVAN